MQLGIHKAKEHPEPPKVKRDKERVSPGDWRKYVLPYLDFRLVGKSTSVEQATQFVVIFIAVTGS